MEVGTSWKHRANIIIEVDLRSDIDDAGRDDVSVLSIAIRHFATNFNVNPICDNIQPPWHLHLQ